MTPLQSLIGSKLNNGFDFYSGHVSLRDIGFLKALTIGDFQLEFGQGLTLWSGLSFGKSSDAINLKRFARGVRPNTSANENLLFSGSSHDYRHQTFVIFSAFYSSHKIDANLVELDTLDNESVFSFFPSGIRTAQNSEGT